MLEASYCFYLILHNFYWILCTSKKIVQNFELLQNLKMTYNLSKDFFKK